MRVIIAGQEDIIDRQAIKIDELKQNQAGESPVSPWVPLSEMMRRQAGA